MADLDVHLAKIGAGDSDAFALWVAGAEFRVRASLSSFSTTVDTEVVVQETLLRIWQVAPKFEPDGRKNSLLRLAIRIAHNLAIDETRRIRAILTDPEILNELLEAHASDGFEPDPLLRRTIELCHDQLSRRPRQALDLRLGGSLPGASDAALAESIGMQLNTFLQNITRARKALAACLREHGIDLEAVTQ